MAFTTVQYIRQVAVAVVTATTTQYTVPASRQDVLKCVTVSNTTAASVTFTMTCAAINLFTAVSVPANQTLTWTGTLVLNAAETITTAASAVGLNLLVSGLESQ
jgi:hypothetical protein